MTYQVITRDGKVFDTKTFYPRERSKNNTVPSPYISLKNKTLRTCLSMPTHKEDKTYNQICNGNDTQWVRVVKVDNTWSNNWTKMGHTFL